MVMGFIRYAMAQMNWSSEGGLRLGIIADAISVNRYEQIQSYLHFVDFTFSYLADALIQSDLQ